MLIEGIPNCHLISLSREDEPREFSRRVDRRFTAHSYAVLPFISGTTPAFSALDRSNIDRIYPENHVTFHMEVWGILLSFYPSFHLSTISAKLFVELGRGSIHDIIQT